MSMADEGGPDRDGNFYDRMLSEAPDDLDGETAEDLFIYEGSDRRYIVAVNEEDRYVQFLDGEADVGADICRTYVTDPITTVDPTVKDLYRATRTKSTDISKEPDVEDWVDILSNVRARTSLFDHA